jgi:hypothetical protein
MLDKGHKHLWEKKVLHRDISVGNIIIASDSARNLHYGYLIDLDHAIPDYKTHQGLLDDVRTVIRQIHYIYCTTDMYPTGYCRVHERGDSNYETPLSSGKIKKYALQFCPTPTATAI